MRQRILATTAAALLCQALPAPASAQQKQPTRDFAITYRVESQGNSAEMRLFHSATTRRQRVEMADAGMVMIQDIGNGRAMILNEQARMAMELPSPSLRQQMLAIPDDMSLSRTGTATVLGHRCTVYRGTQNGADRGTVCLTDEGVMLKADMRLQDKGGTMEATALTLGAQPDTLFTVPEGWQRMQMPQGQPPQRR
ncbi:DUF4412 domain-containing protein [Elioraea rosea]|uniref:DUF4412 domain-containing protein n=1 Tax=Elioraea rosea TaxID=2492390 RepID=UPI0011869641|nr:DUF4412 domain-containing protein [Elioraea rosea]